MLLVFRCDGQVLRGYALNIFSAQPECLGTMTGHTQITCRLNGEAICISAIVHIPEP